MGKAVEQAALQRNHIILAKFDQPEDWEQLPGLVSNKPVVIDFSQPQVVHENILQCFQSRIPVVTGTTGWDDEDRKKTEEICRKEKQSLLIASNFSIGVNLFFALNRYLASRMDSHPEYDVRIEETHHIHKLDKPSGTAKTLAEMILKKLNRKNEWALEKSFSPEQLGITSVREGEVFGDHTVFWDSPSDQLELRHSAKNRRGFAQGAVLAAEWIVGKTGVFGMEDVLGL
jgi:4-hydroxy-tetrahydrodipicolinate reductase